MFMNTNINSINGGKHIILDACVEDVSRFTKDDLCTLFENLAKDLNMEILGNPRFEEVVFDSSKLKGNVFQDEGGITGICIISTSHISVHTWALRKFFSMDVYSCKPFDEKIALKVIDDFFNIETSRITIVDRLSPIDDKNNFIHHTVKVINQNVSTTLGMKNELLR